MNRNAIDLKVGGLARLSTCDWPGQLAATVFCQGCAWDCPYCHNPGLRPARGEECLAWAEIVGFLQSRTGLLDATVFSGGEPTLQTALFAAIAEVKELGFRIGLHTAGMAPERFAQVLPLLDWVGFDVKAPLASYARITGIEGSGEAVRESLYALLASGIPYEVRTTWHPALLTLDDLFSLQDELLALGVQSYAVQRFRSQGVRSGLLPAAPENYLPPGFGRRFAQFCVR